MKAKRLLMSLNERGFLPKPSSRGNRKNEVLDFDQKILVGKAFRAGFKSLNIRRTLLN